MRGELPTILALLGFLTSVRQAQGQFLPEQIQTAALSGAARLPTDTTPYREDAGLAGLGAILGGALGFIAGGVIGGYLAEGSTCESDRCGLEEVFTGALVGEVVGIGLGAHVGNGRRGSALAPVAASLGVLLVAGVVENQGGLPDGTLIFVPMMQIAAAVITETAVGRARVRR
jgi:hypothetical protein